MELDRKRLKKEQKISILRDHFDRGTPISELARYHGIHPVTIYQWIRHMGDKAEEKVNIQELLLENQKLKKELAQMSKLVGKITLKNECLKDINDFLKKKAIEDQLKQQKIFSKPPFKGTPKD
jgi:transposase-like protein